MRVWGWWWCMGLVLLVTFRPVKQGWTKEGYRMQLWGKALWTRGDDCCWTLDGGMSCTCLRRGLWGRVSWALNRQGKATGLVVWARVMVDVGQALNGGFGCRVSVMKLNQEVVKALVAGTNKELWVFTRWGCAAKLLWEGPWCLVICGRGCTSSGSLCLRPLADRRKRGIAGIGIGRGLAMLGWLPVFLQSLWMLPGRLQAVNGGSPVAQKPFHLVTVYRDHGVLNEMMWLADNSWSSQGHPKAPGRWVSCCIAWWCSDWCWVRLHHSQVSAAYGSTACAACTQSRIWW